VDEEADDTREATLVRAFADFVRSAGSGERAVTAGPEPLLSIADAAQYLNVSTTTVRNLAVGGKVRSTRVGDRIRFRRGWLDEWIDAGGGEVPVPPPAPRPEVPERTAPRPGPRPVTRPARPRAEPKPKPPTYIQKVGDQELRLLSDRAGGRGSSTWHIGASTPLCQATGRWTTALKRSPMGFMCKACLTTLAAMPEADLARFEIGRRVYMMRLAKRGEGKAVLRAGYHAGDGRKTLCGKREGPWALTEREPRTKQCFVCDHRRRWDVRDLDPNILVPRPVTPLPVLIDAGPVDPRLVDLIERHPTSIDARQATEPLTKDVTWSRAKWAEVESSAKPIGQFSPPRGTTLAPRHDWNTMTISDNPDASPITTEMALERLPDWADGIERALVLYAKWSKETSVRKRA
jgi:excisionase family DNA binding protein